MVGVEGVCYGSVVCVCAVGQVRGCSGAGQSVEQAVVAVGSVLLLGRSGGVVGSAVALRLVLGAALHVAAVVPGNLTTHRRGEKFNSTGSAR